MIQSLLLRTERTSKHLINVKMHSSTGGKFTKGLKMYLQLQEREVSALEKCLP